jgi:2-keto-4-pentenoate hydratase/2-oxohepta-3-ene-1,7-dioic acid hydratase in catechol pathway
VVDDRVIDLSAAYTVFRASLLSSVPGERGFPEDMLSYIQAGDWARDVAQKIIDRVEASDTLGQDDQFVVPLAEVHVGAPLPNPTKIICAGLNYADHCREQNVPIPERPMLFAKFPSSLIGHEDAITWPSTVSQKVDFEAELAVVIGRPARSVSADEASRYIAGYTIANDISARDVQFMDEQWVRGKSFDTFCPLGPYLVTPDEIPDPHSLAIRCQVNGEVMQDSNTSEMIFNAFALIEFVSKTSTLLPGDIISTGTPNGVGHFQKPPVYLKPGDVVEIEIEGLGRLRNPVSEYVPA